MKSFLSFFIAVALCAASFGQAASRNGIAVTSLSNFDGQTSVSAVNGIGVQSIPQLGGSVGYYGPTGASASSYTVTLTGAVPAGARMVVLFQSSSGNGSSYCASVTSVTDTQSQTYVQDAAWPPYGYGSEYAYSVAGTVALSTSDSVTVNVSNGSAGSSIFIQLCYIKGTANHVSAGWYYNGSPGGVDAGPLNVYTPSVAMALVYATYNADGYTPGSGWASINGSSISGGGGAVYQNYATNGSYTTGGLWNNLGVEIGAFVVSYSAAYPSSSYDYDAQTYINAINAQGCALTSTEDGYINGFFLASKGLGVSPYSSHVAYFNRLSLFNLLIGDGGTGVQNLAGSLVQFAMPPSGAAMGPLSATTSTFTGSNYSVSTGMQGNNSNSASAVVSANYNTSTQAGMWAYYSYAASTYGGTIMSAPSNFIAMGGSDYSAHFEVGNNDIYSAASATSHGFIGGATPNDGTSNFQILINNSPSGSAGTANIYNYSQVQAIYGGFSALRFYALTQGMTSSQDTAFYDDVLELETLLGRN